MKLTFIVTWSWIAVLSPLWVVILMGQFFTCFLIPGFLRADEMGQLVASFAGVWLMGITLLLVSLKLDGELQRLMWTVLLLPALLVLLVQIVAMPKTLTETGSRVILLIVILLLGLQLDAVVRLPWVVIFGPVLFLLLVGIVKMVGNPDDDDGVAADV